MRSFFGLLAFAFGICLLFAMITFVFFNGQIRGATTFWDYLHYAIGSLTTSDVGGMIPTTDAAQIWTAGYVLVAWVYIFWATINLIKDVRFGRIG